MSRQESRLACNPNRWSAPNQQLSRIETETAYYGLEHGFSPEHQKENGVFVIGYYYQINPQQETIYSLNPKDNSIYPQDVRQMLTTTTSREQQEKMGFEKLTQLFFAAPVESLALWICPASNPNPPPRI